MLSENGMCLLKGVPCTDEGGLEVKSYLFGFYLQLMYVRQIRSLERYRLTCRRPSMEG